MTPAEALRELGIEAGATPEAIRRAYLRGVKTRKPETDPEGFRRLREAYELLTRADGPDFEEEPAAPPEPRVRRRISIPLEPFPARERPDFRSPLDLLAEAEELAARDQPAAAAACALRAAAAAERGPADPDFNRRVIGLILRLLAAGALAAADSLYDEIEDLFERAGGEATLIDHATAARWGLLNEIMRLSAGFPQGMRAALALAAEAEDLDAALLDLSRLCRLDRQAAELAKEEIRRLPLLWSAYGSLLSNLTALTDDRPPRGPRSPKRPADLRLDLLIILGILLGVALISHLPEVFKAAERSPAAKPGITLPELRAEIEEACASAEPADAERCAWMVEAVGLLESRRCTQAHALIRQLHDTFVSLDEDPPKLWAIADKLLEADTHCP
jgi:hypothetical protein